MALRLPVLALAFVLLLPLSGLAATSQATTSAPSPENVYLADEDVVVSTSTPADLTAAGGTVSVYAPVAGDVLAAAGTVTIGQPVAGDVRAIAGKVIVNSDVAGDIMVAAGTIDVTGKAHGLYLAGGKITATGGVDGSVTIYGADIVLGGDIAGNVEVIASDHFAIADGTHIHSTLRYNAPEQAALPASARVDGGVTYTGSYSYVPTNEEAHKFAVAGAGIFFVIRTLAGMIVAGLLVGIFPVFAMRTTREAIRSRPRSVLLYGLLGFAISVATPVLILFLLLSIVGAGVALLLGVLYVLLLMLAHIYAGIIAGAALRAGLFSRPGALRRVHWRDAALGVLALNLIALIPVIGSMVKLAFVAVAGGILVTIAYRFAGNRAGGEAELDETA